MAESTRQDPHSGPLLYHEVQISRLCAVHCINTVLQGPYFSEVDLATMAQELDAQEHQVMLESGAGSSHYLNYMAEVAQGSSNVDADGNFSIQVVKRALEIWKLECVPMEAPESVSARGEPGKESAFICHLQAHWFCIRRVGERWYNFNSLYPAPEYLSNFYLSAYLDTLKNSGWSIFVVQGSLPSSGCWGNEDNVGRWLTAEEAERITRVAKESQSKAAASKSKSEKESSKIGSENLAAALAASFAPQQTSSGFSNSYGGDEDAEYASAIAASLADIKCPPSSSSSSSASLPQGNPLLLQPSPLSSSQAPDASALAQALASSLFSAAKASGMNWPAPPPPKD